MVGCRVKDLGHESDGRGEEGWCRCGCASVMQASHEEPSQASSPTTLPPKVQSLASLSSSCRTRHYHWQCHCESHRQCYYYHISQTLPSMETRKSSSAPRIRSFASPMLAPGPSPTPARRPLSQRRCAARVGRRPGPAVRGLSASSEISFGMEPARSARLKIGCHRTSSLILVLMHGTQTSKVVGRANRSLHPPRLTKGLRCKGDGLGGWYLF